MNNRFYKFKKSPWESNINYTRAQPKINSRSFALSRSSHRPQGITLGNNFTQKSRGTILPPVKRPRGCRSCGGAV